MHYHTLAVPEPVFVNLLRRPGIDSQAGGIDSLESTPGLLKRLLIRALLAQMSPWGGGLWKIF
jgi:hypothetical protein